jgi:hypothetical protein
MLGEEEGQIKRRTVVAVPQWRRLSNAGVGKLSVSVHRFPWTLRVGGAVSLVAILSGSRCISESPTILNHYIDECLWFSLLFN